eukprot:2346738-Amphidinium_carterae.1
MFCWEGLAHLPRLLSNEVSTSCCSGISEMVQNGSQHHERHFTLIAGIQKTVGNVLSCIGRGMVFGEHNLVRT